VSGRSLSALCEAAPQQTEPDLVELFHTHCSGPTEVRTCYGQVALTLRCDCPCHAGDAR
jgi:hypothetical protein